MITRFQIYILQFAQPVIPYHFHVIRLAYWWDGSIFAVSKPSVYLRFCRKAEVCIRQLINMMYPNPIGGGYQGPSGNYLPDL